MARPSFSFVTSAGADTVYTSPSGSVTTPEPKRVVLAASETVFGQPRRRKPAGFIPPTDYQFTKESSNFGYGGINSDSTRISDGLKESIHSFGNNNALQWCAGLPETSLTRLFPVIADVFATEAMRDQAIIKARLNMKRQDVNLGVAFAERSRTAKHVGDTAMSLARAVTALKKGRWQDCARHLGVLPPKKAPRGSSLPRKWLEYQYGWQPLLSDVYGSVDALARRPPADWRVSSKGTVTRDLAREEEFFRNYVASHILQSKGVCGYLVRIDALPVNDLLVIASQLGVTNPLTIGWELVPFSFVADWFFPIGKFLDSLDAMLGYEDVWTSTTRFTKVKLNGKGTSFSYEDSGYRVSGGWRGEWTYGYTYMNRVAQTDAPLPTMPRFNDRKSLTHMANGLSLLAAAFPKQRS